MATITHVFEHTPNFAGCDDFDNRAFRGLQLALNDLRAIADAQYGKTQLFVEIKMVWGDK